MVDRDVFAIEPAQLHETRVLSTYLDGHEVYASADGTIGNLAMARTVRVKPMGNTEVINP